jgi:hypothetical protein
MTRTTGPTVWTTSTICRWSKKRFQPLKKWDVVI